MKKAAKKKAAKKKASKKKAAKKKAAKKKAAKKKAAKKKAAKKKTSEDEVTFTGVHVAADRQIHVIGVFDYLAEQGTDHAIVFSLVHNTWYPRLIENSIRGVQVVSKPKPKLLVMGVDGEIETYDVDAERRLKVESVDKSKRGPNHSSFLTSIKQIGGQVYVAGLARRVYCREKPGKWRPADDRLFVPRDKLAEDFFKKGTIPGLWDIDGTRPDNIHGVGYEGEIWHFDGSKWSRQKSPTDLCLNRVLVRSNREVYACGMAGTLLRGDKGSWKQIKHDTTNQDFWGIAYFKGRLYLSGDEGVFVLNGGDLERVDMNLEGEVTTCYLDARDDFAIFSVGDKHITGSGDGETWFEVPSPMG